MGPMSLSWGTGDWTGRRAWSAEEEEALHWGGDDSDEAELGLVWQDRAIL